MNQQGISRRGFLAGTTVTAAAAAIGATGVALADDAADAADAATTATADWKQALNVDIASVLPGNTDEVIEVAQTKSCDVVVIGAGCSGTNTAVRAAELGLNVILVEKSGSIGGCSLLSWAATAYNSRWEAAAGVETETDSIIEEWIADSHWRVNAAAVRQLVNTAGEAVDWMSDNGWEFIYYGAGLNALPDYADREPLFRAMLEEHVTGTGGEVLENTTGKQLVTDDSGAVVGAIVVDSEGAGIQIDAKAVVIATGGYAANTEMVKAVFGFDGVFAGNSYCTGEGLEMAWKVGAQKPQNFGGQMLHQTLARATDTLVASFDAFPAKYPMILTYVANLMNVDSTGARFRNESLVLDAVPSANSSAYQGSFHYVVVSQEIMDILEAGGLTALGVDYTPGMPPEYTPEYELDSPWEGVTEVFDAMVEGGYGYKADTVEGLAEAAGMDSDTFVAQFAQYEEFCATGLDTQCGKSAAYLHAYGEGPYYVIIAEENNLGSWGGLLVNTSYQVLDDDRVPIAGLYAVGSEAGGNLYNDTYVGTGYGMANTITSGYICGNKLAEALL